MRWFAVALAYVLVPHVVSFAGCWLVARATRPIRTMRVVAAFLVAWASLAALIGASGAAPTQFPIGALWLCALAANAIFLFVFRNKTRSPRAPS